MHQFRRDCKHVLCCCCCCSCAQRTKFQFLHEHEGIVVHSLNVFFSLNMCLQAVQLISVFNKLCSPRSHHSLPYVRRKLIYYALRICHVPAAQCMHDVVLCTNLHMFEMKTLGNLKSSIRPR